MTGQPVHQGKSGTQPEDGPASPPPCLGYSPQRAPEQKRRAQPEREDAAEGGRQEIGQRQRVEASEARRLARQSKGLGDDQQRQAGVPEVAKSGRSLAVRQQQHAKG